jgi:competence protein ComEC
MTRSSQPPVAVPRPLDAVWQAPLVRVALAFTAGIILDRYMALDLAASAAAAATLSFFGWCAVRSATAPPIAMALLLGAMGAAGACWHHWQVAIVPADDIRFHTSAEGTMARLRGRIDGAPQHVRASDDMSLRSFPDRDSTRFIFAASKLQARGTWLDVSGRVQTIVPETRRALHVGDQIETVGMLRLPAGPMNPGGFDRAAYLRDERISAVLVAPDSPGTVEVVDVGWPRSLNGWLGKVRSWGNGVLKRFVPDQHGVAAALLLGDTTAMTGEEWDPYLRTGVVHVLAISGQHMLVLSICFWWLLRFLWVPRRWAALAIILLLLHYALLTGARPPIARAGWVAAVFTGGIFLNRLPMPVNTLAFAWLGVAVVNPTAVFNTGLQLSFVAVGMLLWSGSQITFFSQNLVRLVSGQEALPRALEAEVEKTRSSTARLLRRVGTMIARVYLESGGIWLAVAPLVAAQQHLLSPVGLLIGPPVMLLSSFALLAGFLTLAASVVTPLGVVFGWMTGGALMICRWIVGATMGFPGAYFFVPDVPQSWVVGFYLLLAAALTVRHLLIKRLTFLALALWTLIGGAIALWPTRPTEFRCTFLAVGHGGCVVIETPGGRTLVYDAGAITGPEVTRRDIAPYLWSRGLRRVDELLISHGDLDHFNGVPALLERFAIDRVALTPSFADRATPGVGRTMQAFQRLGLAPRVVSAGQTWEVDGVSFEALHPPAQGPEGNENARSLVLLVRYRELSLLLTGDLEGLGLTQVLAQPPRRVEILQAPHHGSRTSNTPALAAWARPEYVISSQGMPRSVPKGGNPYEAYGARWLPTWPHGAVTVRPEGGGFVVETFHTGNRWAVEGRDAR